MQMVVNFFDSVMGFGAATPYTALAQKAMSRHFRCLKDAIAAQLRATCELLGEKDAGTSSGLTKGETPRLRAIDQSLRQQRAFHHMGMMEQEAWRPQRGLPERSVNILRSWLFEHFLHPYVYFLSSLHHLARPMHAASALPIAPLLVLITGSFCFAFFFPCPRCGSLLLRFSKSSNFFEIHAKKKYPDDAGSKPCMPGTVRLCIFLPFCPPGV
jgi:hypothetical protein